MDLLVLGANVACWGAIVVVWIAAALREARRRRGRASPRLKRDRDRRARCGRGRGDRARRAFSPRALHPGDALGSDGRCRHPRRIHHVRHLGPSRPRIARGASVHGRRRIAACAWTARTPSPATRSTQVCSGCCSAARSWAGLGRRSSSSQPDWSSPGSRSGPRNDSSSRRFPTPTSPIANGSLALIPGWRRPSAG